MNGRIKITVNALKVIIGWIKGKSETYRRAYNGDGVLN